MKEMNKAKKILTLVVLTVLVAGAAWGGWAWYDAKNYFRTQDAQITADTVTITSEVTAKIKTWDIREGDRVQAGQILGRQELGMLVGNSGLNSQALEDTADSLVNKAAIRTPIDGKVVLSTVVPGQVVSPGMSIATIADTDNSYIKANIEETDIFKIAQGQAVDVWIDAYPGQTFKGQVERVGQATHQAFNTFPSLNTSGEYSKVKQLIPIRISLLDAGERSLMMGMNTTVRIHLAAQEGTQ